jgi:hypothetical protein
MQTAWPRFAVKDLMTRAPNDLICRIAKQALGRRVPKDDALVSVNGVDTIRGPRENG